MRKQRLNPSNVVSSVNLYEQLNFRVLTASHSLDEEDFSRFLWKRVVDFLEVSSVYVFGSNNHLLLDNKLLQSR